MLYYFLLSGEHRTLPLGEVRAILDAEGIQYIEKAIIDQVAIIDTEDSAIHYLSKRAALTRYAGKVLRVAESTDDINEIIKDIDWDRLENIKSITVAFRRIKEYSQHVIYSKVIESFKKYSPVELKLKKADGTIDVILSDGLLIIGLRIYERDMNKFRVRDPQRRPVYRPGTLTPLMSRVFVNLSRVSLRKKETFFDPFCGVGGFLLEACVIGLKNAGSDLSELNVKGAYINLSHYGCVPNVAVADACRIPCLEVDGIGTDPPYGRLTRVEGGQSIEKLMECFLNEAADVVRKGKYMVFAQEHSLELDDLIRDVGFEIVEKHKNWVHGALTRDIYVVRRV
jgi:tRNA (guanine10-N2)-dimethyltransferase